MSRTLSLVLICFILVVFSGCAAKQTSLDELQLSIKRAAKFEEAYARASAIQYNILRENPDISSKKKNIVGLYLGTMGAFYPEWKPGMGEFHSYPEGVFVRNVTEGLPAAKAGIQRGDVIKKIGYRDWFITASAAINMLKDDIKKTGSVEITYERDSKERTVVIVAEEYPSVSLWLQAKWLPYVNLSGRDVQIGDQMVKEAEHDDEIAILLAREMSLYKHGYKSRKDISKQERRKVDTDAFNMIAKAGYSKEIAAQYLCRLSGPNPEIINYCPNVEVTERRLTSRWK
jgi:membrane-associated protease RseP (regulator of RpoE activity)